MISTDIKTDVKQEINKLVAVSYNSSQMYLLKIEIQCKAGLCILSKMQDLIR